MIKSWLLYAIYVNETKITFNLTKIVLTLRLDFLIFCIGNPKKDKTYIKIANSWKNIKSQAVFAKLS